jgi:hypothetical protein
MKGRSPFTLPLITFNLPLIICYLVLPLREKVMVNGGDVLPPSYFP